MGSTDNYFEATGPNFAGFYAPPDEDDNPVFTFGARLFGEAAGVLGFCGSDGPNQQNIYTRTAGVMGSSDGATGVAGTALHKPPRHRPVEESPPGPGGPPPRRLRP